MNFKHEHLNFNTTKNKSFSLGGSSLVPIVGFRGGESEYEKLLNQQSSTEKQVCIVEYLKKLPLTVKVFIF